MTRENGIMVIRIDGMEQISGRELETIIDWIVGDWDCDDWNFDTLSRIEFPSFKIEDTKNMIEIVKEGLPEDLLIRARLSIAWWTYDGHDRGMGARLKWEASE